MVPNRFGWTIDQHFALSLNILVNGDWRVDFKKHSPMELRNPRPSLDSRKIQLCRTQLVLQAAKPPWWQIYVAMQMQCQYCTPRVVERRCVICVIRNRPSRKLLAGKSSCRRRPNCVIRAIAADISVEYSSRLDRWQHAKRL